MSLVSMFSTVSHNSSMVQIMAKVAHLKLKVKSDSKVKLSSAFPTIEATRPDDSSNSFEFKFKEGAGSRIELPLEAFSGDGQAKLSLKFSAHDAKDGSVHSIQSKKYVLFPAYF